MSQTYIDQQTKIDEQNALIESKDRENPALKRKTESLQSENAILRDSNNKSLGLLLEIANINPELRGKFTKDDAGMEMG